NERLAQVVAHVLRRPRCEGLLLERRELFPLAEVGAPRDDLTVVLRLDEVKDDARVEPAGVGEDQFLDGGGAHGDAFLTLVAAMQGLHVGPCRWRCWSAG